MSDTLLYARDLFLEGFAASELDSTTYLNFLYTVLLCLKYSVRIAFMPPALTRGSLLCSNLRLKYSLKESRSS